METVGIIPEMPSDYASMPMISREMLDPLEADRPDDEVIVMTKRSMCRIALVAAETGGRFEREGIGYDPMSWMLAPRLLFDGNSAIEACAQLDHCRRSILVHGLGLGLDVAPSAIDALIADKDTDDDDENGHKEPTQYTGGNRKKRRVGSNSSGATLELRLWTATMSHSSEELIVNAFHASLATNVHDVVERLRRRYGIEIASGADIRIGFHQSMPIVLALIQEPMAEMIRQIDNEPLLADADRFSINIEHRIQP